MRYVVWVLRFILFLILLSFALQNTEMVTLNIFSEHHWRAPLIFIVLASFIAGAVFGVLASLSSIVILRRKLIDVRKKLKEKPPEPIGPVVVERRIEPPRDAL